MADSDWLADAFEEQRGHLRAVAYRLLRSLTTPAHARPATWLRLTSAEASKVDNLGGWLTTVVARVSLNMLRSRQHRREDPFGDSGRGPASAAGAAGGAATGAAGMADPEFEAVLADSVGLALMVVLDTLSPAERLAFVLHDMFGVSFEEIGPIVDRNAAATRQLASRARRRVRGAPEPDAATVAHQRKVVDAFLAASRDGDFDALLEVLDPDVVFRAEAGPTGPPVPALLRGADDVANAVLTRGRPFAHLGRPAIVNGRPGAFVAFPDRVVSLVAFTIVGDRVTEMDLLLDPVKLQRVRDPNG